LNEQTHDVHNFATSPGRAARRTRRRRARPRELQKERRRDARATQTSGPVQRHILLRSLFGAMLGLCLRACAVARALCHCQPLHICPCQQPCSPGPTNSPPQPSARRKGLRRPPCAVSRPASRPTSRPPWRWPQNMASISLAYLSAVTLRLSLSVAVSSPPFSEKSPGRTVNFWIFCALETV